MAMAVDPSTPPTRFCADRYVCARAHELYCLEGVMRVEYYLEKDFVKWIVKVTRDVDIALIRKLNPNVITDNVSVVYSDYKCS